MKIKSIVLPAAALGFAGLLLTPSESVGFSTNPGTLNQTQRKFRVFNNFTDVQANNNVTPHPNFPGADGAEMALWKGCIEWSSQLHADGDGDTHQPFGLGSGGANFDPFYNGLATGTGGTNGNTHSELSGGSGGTLAFTETPIADGWRIRYYSNWTWHDGPGPVNVGVCLQGVATHEYGHALGLGHSTAPGASMRATIAGSGTGTRSINSDDQAGVQFKYGVIDTVIKPSITSVTGGSTLTITGTNFAATNNEVWFNSNGTTNPVKVIGLSSNGTTLVLNAPAGAFPGDVMVKQGGNGTHKGLSNAWPWAGSSSLTFGGDCTVAQFCSAGLSASGCQPTLEAQGVPSASAPGGFVVSASGVAGQSDGLFFTGTGPQASPWGQGTSLQCIAGPVVRAPLQAGSGTLGACDGSFALDLNALWRAAPNGGPAAGADVSVQLWYRDALGQGNAAVSFSNAIHFQVCP
jgi:hypothetical protein